MRAIVNFFSDLGGMPLLMTFGMYRIFPARDFSREICFGYVAELTTSLIPMLVIQIMNNELHVGEFSWLQMSCMILRFLSLFTLSMEILILTFEYRYNSKMRGAGFRTFHPRQGEERSKAYSERMAKVTFISILGMLSLLVGGLVLTEGRSCYGDGSVLHWGVCTACEDRMCADCWQGPEICSTCLIGYREDKVTGKCVDCDGDPELTKCERCHIGPFGGNECLQCAKGYHLDPRHNQCLACSELTGVAHCASCDSKKGTCDTCREGYYFREVDGKKHCAKCSDKFEFCDTCNEKQCTSCYDHIATFDKNGHCRSCTAPWLSSQS